MAKVGGNTTTSSGIVDAGFARLQGKNFEYYMQTYSIILGRSSKKSAVDVDLKSLGGGMNISRQHARIFYDFEGQHFALDVIGKNGCLVQGVVYLPGTPSVKLHSQDLLQMGDLKFYFLLPSRSIFASVPQRNHPDPVVDAFVVQNGELQLSANEDRKGNENELIDDCVGARQKEIVNLLEMDVVGSYALTTGIMAKPGSAGLSGIFISNIFFHSFG